MDDYLDWSIKQSILDGDSSDSSSSYDDRDSYGYDENRDYSDEVFGHESEEEDNDY